MNLIAGAIGGNAAGKASPSFDLGTLGNTISGLVGGGVLGQLRAWGLSDLVTAGSTLSANVLAARQNAGLAQAIAGRSLLSLARKGLALRLDR